MGYSSGRRRKRRKEDAGLGDILGVPRLRTFRLRRERAGGLKRKKTAPSALAERAECNELAMILRGSLEPTFGSSAVLGDHPMWTLVPNYNQILLTNPPAATAPGPRQDLVAVPELGESHLGAMPAGAEDLDSVGHPAADIPWHGHLSNHTRSAALPRPGSR